MDILITILTVQFFVLFFYWGGVGVKSLFKDKPIIRPQKTSIQMEPVGWNSFRHSVSDVEGKFIVEEAFKTKRNHYALRIRNLKTGESRTVYGKDSYDVSDKAKRIFLTWEISQ